MFRSYLFSALLNLRKQPAFSAIKVLSLTLGLMASILVSMHVQFVQSSNKHIANWQNTYRLLTHLKMREINQPYRTSLTATAYASNLALDYAEQIEHIAQISFAGGNFSRGTESSRNGFIWAEADIAAIFGLEFIQGDAATALIQPNTMIISVATAEKYFGEENPLGQTLTWNEDVDLQVTGVIRDQPINATHRVEIAVSAATGRQQFGPDFLGGNNWLTFGGTQTFLTLTAGTPRQWFDDNMPDFISRRLPEQSAVLAADLEFGLSLQPINEIYLNPLNNFAALETNTGKTILFGLMLFALLILGTSCINYMNLSLSQMSQRRKEIGVRKTLGASRIDIIWQFLMESLLLTLISLLIALPAVAAVIPAYTALTDTSFVFFDIFRSSLVAALVLLVFLTGLIAGIIPALSLSKVEAAHAVKGSFTRNRLASLGKAAVTASQFTISTVLILLALATYVQTRFLQQMDIGFDKDNLLIMNSTFNRQDPDAFNYEALKNEIQQHPGVRSLATANLFPPFSPGLSQFRLARGDPNSSTSVVFTSISTGFIETYGFELLAGRTFSEDFPADLIDLSEDVDPERTYGIVITDLLARRFGIDSPEDALGEVFIQAMGRGGNFHVIGVISQFKLSSGLESDQRTVGILMGASSPLQILHVRIDPQQTEAALAHIDDTWETHRPGTPINRTFYSQSLNDMIQTQNEGISTAALIASVITIIIAVSGLYALASYATISRTKEVGVRKVLGATSGTIVLLLAWDFIKPVLISCLVAWPIAYFAINFMYSSFSAQASFTIRYYALVTLAIILVASLTVVIQCFRTANSDPVQSLRYE